MIKNILLHIGVHKTASTTIQNTFYNEREKLASEGILYPVFNVGKIAISNHSIPFYSLFCYEPEKYHFNVSHRFKTGESITQLHADYRNQLVNQIKRFNGDTLVISGEDISHLSRSGFENLKSFLFEITASEVNIKVVIFCRHPVSHFRSALQGSVCAFGMTMEKATEYHLRPQNAYQNLFNNTSVVFGRTQHILVRYEDAVAHTFGPAGMFLSLMDKNLPDKIKPVLLHHNPTRNYETFVLLNAVNQVHYHNSNEVLQPARMKVLNGLFKDMPGHKFMLPKGLSKNVWQTLSDDVNWLCCEFALPEYKFVDEDLKSDSDIWSRQTLDYLKMVFTNFSDFQKKVFLNALLHEMQVKRKTLTFNRLSMIFGFVMFYSKFLQAGSHFGKFKYFVKSIGFEQSFKHSLYFFIKKCCKTS